MRKHRVDVLLVVLVIAMLAISLLTIYAIGPRVALAEGKPENTYFIGHLRSIVVAAVALTVGASLIWRGKIGQFLADNREKIAKYVLLVVILLNVYVALGRFGAPLVQCELGACRWLNVGISLQPSELLKVAVLFYVPWLIQSRKEQGTYGEKEFWVPFATLAMISLFVVGFLQKDLGNTVVIIFMMAVMVFVAGISWKQFGIILLCLAIAGLALVGISGDSSGNHREERLNSWLNGSYHSGNALMSFGTGGLTGVGIGNSVSSTGYLPEAISDSIFPIIGEIWGYFGAMLVLVAYVLMLLHIEAVAHRTEDSADRMMVLGVFAWILAHVIMHVGGMTGLIPMKGTTLPFLSYGGSSLMCVAFAYGMVLQKSCWTKRGTIDEDTSSRGRQWRSRYTGNRRRT